MKKLENIGLDTEEIAAVNQVRKVSALRKSQAGHLQTHWKMRDQAALDQFHKARRQSWVELRAVLGLGKSE